MPSRSRVGYDEVQGVAQHGLVRVSTLVELGLSRSTVHRRCTGNGRWQRVLPGVVALHRGPLRRIDMIRAALIYAGPHALVTGLDACRLHKLRGGPEPGSVHLLVPARCQIRSTSWVKIERTTRMPDPVKVGSVPTAPPVRAVLDAARRRSSQREVTAMLAEVVQRRLCPVRALLDEVNAGSSFGSALPRRVLREIAGDVHSVPEFHARRLLRGTNLPKPTWNQAVVDTCGRQLGVPDAWFDDVAMAWEIDSVEYHSGPEGYAATMAKHSRMAAAGVIVVHTLPSWLRSRPAQVLDDLLRAYEHARRRPRPDVRVLPPAA